MRAISLAIPFVAAGLMFAQSSPQAQQGQSAAPPATVHHQHRRPDMMRRLTAELNLTSDQQTHARAIFAKAREERKALAPQLRSERQAMLTAVKSDSPAQIDKLTAQNADLNAKVRAIHERSIAEFHALLNPDQKAKFDRHLDRMFGEHHMQARRQHAQSATQS